MAATHGARRELGELKDLHTSLDKENMRPYCSYMLRINKVSEYGIMALGYIGHQTQAVSARQVSEGLQLPYEITAKTLQRLKDAGFVRSTKGARGGYCLNHALSE